MTNVVRLFPKDNDAKTILSKALLDQFIEAAPILELLNKLTRREVEVLYLLLKGLTRSDIGQAMQLSQVTVETYLYKARKKLNVSSTQQLRTHLAVALLYTALPYI